MHAPRTQHLKIAEIRHVHRIFDEARELGHAYAARRHMAFELCRLVNARQAYYVCFDGFTPTDLLSVRDMVIGGWPDEQMLWAWQKWRTRKMLREDPLVHLSSHQPDGRVTALRNQIATERQWKSSTVYESLAGPRGLGDIIIAYFRCREPGRITGFSIQRGDEEDPFTPRDRCLVELFNDEFYRRYSTGDPDVAGLYEPPPPLLAPRQRQVLELLLNGVSAAAVADRLRLSRRTLDDYTQALYQKFDVASRGELMAHFVKQRRGTR